MLARRGRISNTPITAVPMTPMATKNVDSMVSRRPMASRPTPTVSKPSRVKAKRAPTARKIFSTPPWSRFSGGSDAGI
jgi:hypothetical protein